MFQTLLVANRGEIARRVTRTAHRLGMKVVAVHSEADAGALHVREADESVLLGAAPAADSYLDAVKVLEAAARTHAEAIHPGYGFLAEDAGFAQAVLDAGLVWVGPPPAAIEAMGDKITALQRMSAAGVPVSRASGALPDADAAVEAAREIGYPVMVKASAGGGGIGMAVARDEAQLRAAFATARTRAERAFGSGTVFVESYVEGARHVEVQVLGLADGRVVTLGERDCSVQRRHQKLAEETPSPGVGAPLRAEMLRVAARAAEAVDYRGAGTVECLVDPVAQRFVFLEMNTRLQVEHPVTELVAGVDIVEQQLRIAAGLEPSFDPGVTPVGHAIELRVCAEDPVRFFPSPGTISRWDEPTGAGVRVDSAVAAGDVVTPHYDSLLAKLCVWGADRPAALERARDAVAAFAVEGPKTTLPFFARLLDDPGFVAGDYDTGIVGRLQGTSGR